MRSSLLVLSLALPSTSVAVGASPDDCLSDPDHASLISLQTTASQQHVATAQNTTVSILPPLPRTLYIWDRREWGYNGSDGYRGWGDGRADSNEPVILEEVFEDIEEEKDIRMDMQNEMINRTLWIAAGKKWIDLPPVLPALHPRARGVDGCLLGGPPVELSKSTFIAAALIINLDTRPDRWDYITQTTGYKTLQAKGIPFTRWSGVRLRNKLEVEKLEGSRYMIALDKLNHTDNSTGLTRARDSWWKKDNARYFAKLSCFMSHLETMTHLAQKWAAPGRVYLVLEDDWEIVRDLPTLLADIVWAVGDDWDAIRLDCWLYGKSGGIWPNDRVFRTDDALRERMNYGGTQAILYRGESMKKVANYFKNHSFREVDSLFFTDKIKSYCVNWGIVSRVKSLGSNVNHAKSFMLPGDATDEEPVDAYEEFLIKTEGLKLRGNWNPLEKTKKQIENHRNEHTKRCRFNRQQLKIKMKDKIAKSNFSKAV